MPMRGQAVAARRLRCAACPARLAGGHVVALGALALVLVGAVGCTPSSHEGRPTVATPQDVDRSRDVVVLTPEGSPLQLRQSLVADHYFWLRVKALEGEAPPAFVSAFGAMVDMRSELSGDPTAWEDLEVPLGTARGARDLTAAYGSLPEARDVAGKNVPLRTRALRLSHTMEGTERAFRAGPFREHDEEIRRAAKELSALLLPKFDAILAAIQADMALPSVGAPIVLTLVGDAPYPGIFAADARGHDAASFVRVRGLEGGALVETALHESLHAIDELTVRAPTAMNMLRGALQRRGIDASDPNVEMAINTLTFAEAASLVRRFVDPNHKPLGESGFYTLFPPAAAIVAAWNRHVAEGASLDVTADAIAAAVGGS